ncbi:MAG: hypothetical protein ACK52I_24155 [Pseudomonadota bacterium]
MLRVARYGREAGRASRGGMRARARRPPYRTVGRRPGPGRKCLAVARYSERARTTSAA